MLAWQFGGLGKAPVDAVAIVREQQTTIESLAENGI
jgi:hypothetical protein